MIEKTVLPGGVRLVTERLPHTRSAAFGIWVGTGARHETPKLAGASHALEHMVFKGTKTRSAADIARTMDGMGGQLNAFTTKECTCFYGRTLESHLTDALSLVCDIFFNANISDDDWTVERGVILEEIDMYRDAPEDLVSERLFAGVFQGSRLAFPVLGNPRALKAMTAAQLSEYRRTEYRPQDIVVSLAGSFSKAHIRYLTKQFTLPSIPDRRPHPQTCFKTARVTRRKAIEQNHWCLGFPGLQSDDDRRHTLRVLSGVVGGGMSSRLFQAVREQSGLCYDVSSYAVSHRDVGMLGVYVGLNKDSQTKALPMIRGILEDIAAHGPTEDEVDRTREQIKSSAVMSMEATSARMSHMGQSELMLGHILTLDETIERCDAVSRQGCHELAAELLDFDRMAFSAIGQVAKPDDYFSLLGIE